MIYLIAFILFITGLFVGSFLNVVIDRIPRKETVVKGRSYCEFCKKELKWYDLIPLLSFIFLKGKCRYCHTKLSFFYPAIEISTGILFLLTYFFAIFNFQFLISNEYFNALIFNPKSLISLAYYLFIVSSFIIIFFEDLKYGVIPDKIVFPAITVSLVYLFFFNQQSLIINLFSGLGAFLFFLVLYLATKGKGMGFGDVKLVLLLGFILGFPGILLALYMAFLTGAFVGLILIIWKKKSSIKDTISFGPFLIGTSLISLFWGGQLYSFALMLLGI